MSSERIRLPQEVIAREIIPLLRGLVAHILVREKYSQHQIAAILGVSQPMISRYLSKPLDYYYRELRERGVPQSIIDHIAFSLQRSLPQTQNVVERVALLASAANYLFLYTRFCQSHEFCSKLFGVISDSYVKEVEKAVEELTKLKGFEKLLPHVGSNIVYAPLPEEGLKGVIGIEGRIHSAGDRVVVGGRAIYGGSRHTGTILLEVVAKDPSKKAAIILRYDQYVLKAVEALNRSPKILYVQREKAVDEPVEKAIIEAIRKSPEAPDAIVDRGGYGIEPVIYLFAENPSRIVEKVKTIIRILQVYGYV